MTPTYSRDGIELYLGKLEDVLPHLPRYDALLMDPPYGIGEAKGKNKTRGNLAVSKDYGNLDWDDKTLSPDSMYLCLRAAVSQIVWGGNYYRLGPATCWLIWNKLNGSNDFADCELAWTNLDQAVRKIDYMWNGMLRDGYDVRVHPTQKPVDVMRWCISQFPKKTETIIDPCMGSGTTAIACIRSEKKFVGIEMHQPYFDIAVKRIEEEYKRTPMFEQPQKQQEMF